MKKSFTAGLLAILFAIACIGPAIAADNASGTVAADTENYTPAVGNNSQLPENCNTEIRAVGNGTIAVGNDGIKVISPGKRGNLGHKYPDSNSWCAAVAGRFSDGEIIGYAFSNNHKSVTMIPAGMKIVQVAAVGSGRIR